MKVEGPNKTSGTKGVSKTGAKKSTGDGTFSALVSDTEETEAQSPVSRTASVGALDALLMLQAAEDGASGKKARKRASDLLDHLEKIRIGLLTGELPSSTLHQLSQAIAAQRETVLDPKLNEILDDIDLRAQVELAKLEMK